MKFLIQNMTRCTKKDSQTVFFSKILIPILFLNENNFFRNNFSKNAQKDQHWRLYGVYWPAKLFLVSQFSKKSWFSNNTFFIENWCGVNILTQVLTLSGNQFKLWREAWGVAKKLLTFLIKIWRVVKRCFEIWHAVKIPIPKMTSCLKLTENLTYFEILDSK